MPKDALLYTGSILRMLELGSVPCNLGLAEHANFESLTQVIICINHVSSQNNLVGLSKQELYRFRTQPHSYA